MNEQQQEEIAELVRSIRKQHGIDSVFHSSIPISETFQGKKVWEGIVHVFSVIGHPEAKSAYAWSAPIEGSKKHRYYAVLGIPPINSAQDAVKAAIVQEYRSQS